MICSEKYSFGPTRIHGTSSDDPGLEILINKIQFSDVFFSDVFSFNTWHCDILYLDSVHFIICNSIINNNSDQIQ